MKRSRLLSEQMLDNAILKDVTAKNVCPALSVQGRFNGDGFGLRRCIRPLASGAGCACWSGWVC